MTDTVFCCQDDWEAVKITAMGTPLCASDEAAYVKGQRMPEAEVIEDYLALVGLFRQPPKFCTTCENSTGSMLTR